jgi:hypothetical protein
MKNLKEYPRQTYAEIIEKMINIYEYTKKQNQYDEFLHKVQKDKMKELWENSEDEDWERV